MNNMARWNKLLGDTRAASVLGKQGNMVKEEHKKLDARGAKAPKIYREPKPRPARVQAAVLAQDNEACARFGRAGGKAPRKKKVTITAGISRQDEKDLRNSQSADRYFGSLAKAREANEHICPVDD